MRLSLWTNLLPSTSVHKSSLPTYGRVSRVKVTASSRTLIPLRCLPTTGSRRPLCTSVLWNTQRPWRNTWGKTILWNQVNEPWNGFVKYVSSCWVCLSFFLRFPRFRFSVSCFKMAVCITRIFSSRWSILSLIYLQITLLVLVNHK